jgi:hypothetical protein
MPIQDHEIRPDADVGILWLASRLAALAICVIALVCAVLGDPRGQAPAAVFVACMAATTGLAPLFWPPDAGRRPLATLLLWCCGVAIVATTAGCLLTVRHPPIAAMIASAALAGAISLALHGVIVASTRGRGHARRPSRTAREAWESRRILAIAAFAIASLAPVWLGPAAELAGNASPLPQLTLSVSPLMQFADAAQCDLLRQSWFYAHSNLGALRASYPSWPLAVGAYLGVAVLCAIVVGLRSAAVRPLHPRSLSAGQEDVSCV